MRAFAYFVSLSMICVGIMIMLTVLGFASLVDPALEGWVWHREYWGNLLTLNAVVPFSIGFVSFMLGCLILRSALKEHGTGSRVPGRDEHRIDFW